MRLKSKIFEKIIAHDQTDAITSAIITILTMGSAPQKRLMTENEGGAAAMGASWERGIGDVGIRDMKIVEMGVTDIGPFPKKRFSNHFIRESRDLS